MNIKEAKQEISHTLQAYLEKDELGNYCYALVRQRPILLMGPPGIGKTAIMEQIAAQCGVGLVAYTITHHTRQSAVGLPKIVTRTYDGQEVSVTEYTLSEIIASVYDCMERTGKREGILFIDEINCASETLAPTMLQFLQCKTFGNQAVPKGWVIVAAGNPPEYNKSVREFDVVTLDRIRRIDVEEDFQVWKEYAYQAGIHPAILAYLEIHKQNFYRMETSVDGRLFVTARGWEDLSQFLYAYERLEKRADREVIGQYLQYWKIAKDFANYLELFEKYKKDYSYPKKGDILISAAGTIGRTVVFDGKPAYFQDSNIVWIDNDESIVLNRYLYYYYQLQPWKASTGGTIARLYNDNIRDAVISVPSLSEQECIVGILDRFDALCNDLSSGLPAEIEARQKQYEYYRDRLLNFEPITK